jgi:periplasmic protein TonB
MIARRPAGLGGPIGVSAIVHAAAFALLIIARSPAPAPSAPVYRVNLVAAPSGTPAIGIVRPPEAKPAPTPTPTPPPRRAAMKPNEMPLPKPRTPRERPQPAPATPNAAGAKARTDATAPTAGGGERGDKGADVATVNTAGIEFPYPAYLENIVRQIRLNFKPRNAGAALKAEVFFIVQRDGSVTGIRLITSSASYAYNLEAVGAVEAAARSKSFGPLPSGFSEPSLPVTFFFDQQIHR